MCGCGGDGPSDGGVPGSPPGGTTGGTGLCCTCDATGTVNQLGNGTYFDTTLYALTPITNKCTIEIARTTSGGTVTITKSFSIATANLQSPTTEASAISTTTTALSTAMTNWTSGASGYKVRIEQPSCDPQELTMVFRSSIVASGADVAVTSDGTSTAPSNAIGGTTISFKLLDGSSWTMTHEIGHTFGLPDEYCTVTGVPIVPAPAAPGARTIDPPAVSPTTTYKGNPPQADVTITQTANFPSRRRPGKYVFDNPSIMGQDGNTTYEAHHFFWVAMEVKKILAAEGAPSTVTII